MSKNQIIIYGAGARGKSYYDLFSRHGKTNLIYGFCDSRFSEMASIHDKKIYSYDSVKDLGLPFVVSPIREAGTEIHSLLRNDGQIIKDLGELTDLLEVDRVTLYREFCACSHVDAKYFKNAEDQSSLETFWGKDSPFLHMFKELDLSNVIELACGQGRHVQKYASQAGKIMLVDILQENIAFCKERFQDEKNIYYYCNNGYNLEELKSGCYSALFSYDAVVHFEMMDIFEYLKDIFRVLLPGGLVLIHHSNNDCDYKAAFHKSPHARSFMSKDIFAYLAYRAGFDVRKQQVIDWGSEKNLDCITLLQKPKS